MIKREPNTEYILSLSYGKDSIACLEAIKQLGYPLDRIIHAEVWATDTIPADLPPMVEFKKYADKIIEEKYGIKVEHFCAVRGVRNSHTKESSTVGLTNKEQETTGKSTDSLTHSERGVTANSKLVPCSQSQEKITYEKLFYQILKNKAIIRGFPGLAIMGRAAWCTGELKKRALNFLKAPLHKGRRKILCSTSE